jgi:hypothetical protein
MGKTPKRKTIPKNIRNLVWQKYNPNSLQGKCYACNRPITFDNFDIGHNKAIANGGKNNILNLKPICRPCNSGMGTMSIEKFKKKYFGIKVKDESTTDSNSIKIEEIKTKKSSKQIEKPISKRKLLKELSYPKLKKIAKKLDLDPQEERLLVIDKDEYIDILSGSRKITVEKIQEILGL